MLGKDADKYEYWFFKEDLGKLFVKKYEDKKDQLVMMDEEDDYIPELKEPKYWWFFYDEEDEVEKLIEACNLKGIRERKLQENLRKIADRLKLKKSKVKKEIENKEEDKKQS